MRVSGRARNLRIQVFPHGGVEIVAPKRSKPAEIEAFVNEHRDWIRQTQSEFHEIRTPEPLLPDEIELRAIGETYRIHYATGATGSARERDSLVTIRAPLLTPEHCWPLLQGWLKKQGRAHLRVAAMNLGAQLRLQPKRVHVRLQRTRWGSCSTTGTISLNAGALLRSAEELRYIMVHELCHLRHMNHSRRYWQLVESYVPDYKDIEQSLDAAWQTSPRWLIG